MCMPVLYYNGGKEFADNMCDFSFLNYLILFKIDNQHYI